MIEILKKRLSLLMIIPIASIFTAAIISLLMAPVYLATTTIMVVNTTGEENPVSDYNFLNLNRQLVKTYGELATEQVILQEVTTQLNGITAIELADKITVTPVKDLELLRISVRDENPEIASFIANKIVDVLRKKTTQLYEKDNIKVVSYADIPVKPDQPDFLVNIAGAFLAGLIVAIIISFCLEEKLLKADQG
ncbi:Capsular polysaccharide type 8 biosynthesis protein cap8A [Pelotomaculum schinkii]|uniref:Capsular polysaccharide type 8 biosynthesis protein cap8A n=1 Tax=Pelotomaculum schinkii TaxID=78350 RepID=A0A4Y7RC65_9FIRM|nr:MULTISPECIES: Wzz/FepE/Etk N-terminal domain-containing protein [Pelotomaculum]TEB06605.1 Capsular polysaccharide type 8 biosynthesis protein cap8A [Pelotomaculum schinkii]TEB17600.1 Capsular polysaccharide type 8 biosynthesis protein cap8A [Pelotomaculum sp. FP]